MANFYQQLTITLIFNLCFLSPLINGGCYQFRLCCKSRNASCVSFETGSGYHQNYYTLSDHHQQQHNHHVMPMISTRLPRNNWNPAANVPSGRKRSNPISAHDDRVTAENLIDQSEIDNNNSTGKINNNNNNTREIDNDNETDIDYSTPRQSTIQVRIRNDVIDQDTNDHVTQKSENLMIYPGQSESIFDILNETQPQHKSFSNSDGPFQNDSGLPFQDNSGPFPDESGPFQDQFSGYDDLEYGSGGTEDMSFLGTNFLIESDANYNSSSGDTIAINQNVDEDQRYRVINNVISDKGHKRRHTVDLMTDYTGKTKEISYIIVGEPNSVVFDSVEKVGLLQPDKNVARLCYCDEQCGLLNDCCSDYKETCPPIDCVVSAWSQWGHCQRNHKNNNDYNTNNGNTDQPDQTESVTVSVSECGPGISLRMRTVLQDAENGGAECPHLEEQKACYSADERTECGYLASEMALLLPYVYSEARQPGYKSSVYYDLPKDSDKSDGSENYCSIFEMHWYNANCSFGFDNGKARVELRPGDKVCVECQQAARRRSFLYLSDHHPSDHNNGGGQHMAVIDRYSTFDPTQDDARKRCAGDGAKNTETLWSLVAGKANHCFGQWSLVEKVTACKCMDKYPKYPRFIFV